MNDPMSDAPQESLFMRLLFLILIAFMLSLASTVTLAATVVQFILMVTNRGKPNVELAWFGKRMGDWIAKATRYQTAADEEKPWPWTPLE